MTGDNTRLEPIPELQVLVEYDGTRMPYSGVDGPWAGILRCPRCGGQYMHQREVTVTHRAAEDGPGYALTVQVPRGPDTKVHRDGTPMVARTETRQLAKEEIPYRRNSLTIEFTCEGCERVSEGKGPRKATLEIAQHKGRTFMRWILEENPTVGINIYTGRPPQP